MKSLFYFLIGLIGGVLLITFSIQAMAYEVPKDAVIKVYTKDGKQIGEMSRKAYKVVKIEENKKVKILPVIVKEVHKKNTIVFHAGVGNDGLTTKHKNGAYEVSPEKRAVFGVTYCRSSKGKGICATGMTNNTATLGIKSNF